MKTKLILIAIILFGFFLRIIDINSNPSALYGDELTIVLDSYSLLKTGHDQLGNFLPLTFPMGAGRPAGYVYGSIPFVAIFGPTALGVRMLSILSGVGILILLYLICKKLFSTKTGLLVAAIGSISPWDISLSRGGFEAHFALFLALLGIYLFLKASKKPMLYLLSALSFGLTLHTYPTYKISLLLFLPLLVWLGDTRGIMKNGKKYFWGGALILLVLGLVSLSQTFIGGSENRFADINIFSKVELKASIEQKINLERQITKIPAISKYFQNKPVEYVKIFIENYLENFSMDFLILHGDRNPRHNMATMGGLYGVEIILITLGLLVFWLKERRKILFLLFWIAIAPLPSAMVDLPHALRSAFMLPPLTVLSALGLAIILNRKNKILLSLVLLGFMIQFVFFVQKLYFLAPNEYSSFWSYPAKLATEIVLENKNKFDYILLSDRINDIEFAYPVYVKIDPSVVISQNQNKSFLSNLAFKKFDNVFIGDIPDGGIENFIQNLPGSVLFIGDPGSRASLGSYDTLNGKDEQTALILKRKQI